MPPRPDAAPIRDTRVSGCALSPSVAGAVGAPEGLHARERERRRFDRRQRPGQQIVGEEGERLDGHRAGQLVDQRSEELLGAHRRPIQRRNPATRAVRRSRRDSLAAARRALLRARRHSSSVMLAGTSQWMYANAVASARGEGTLLMRPASRRQGMLASRDPTGQGPSRRAQAPSGPSRNVSPEIGGPPSPPGGGPHPLKNKGISPGLRPFPGGPAG